MDGPNFLNIFANHMPAVEAAIAQINTIGNYERVLRSLNTIVINAQDEHGDNQQVRMTAKQNIKQLVL